MEGVVLPVFKETLSLRACVPEFPPCTHHPGAAEAPEAPSVPAAAVVGLRHHFPETTQPDISYFNSLIMFITTPAASCAVKGVISSYWFKSCALPLLGRLAGRDEVFGYELLIPATLFP